MLRSESKTRTNVSAFFLCRRIGFMLQKECKLYLVEAWLLLLLEKNILWHLTLASQPELSLSGYQSLLFCPRLSRLLLHVRNFFHTIVHYLTPLILVLLIPPLEQAPPFWSNKLISPTPLPHLLHNKNKKLQIAFLPYQSGRKFLQASGYITR